jgi:pyruvate/2-oxoglutarate dehydrogenase complex dihydrolipoamide dehydrogenase (E3) component
MTTPQQVASVLTPDLCVIGAGSGGLSVAAAAAAFNVSVVLIEKAKMGGDCLNFGCVPSKALIAAASRAQAIRAAVSFGVRTARPAVEFGKVLEHVRHVIGTIAPNDSAERFTGLGVHVILGAARFKNRSTVTVGNGLEITARRFVVATGSSPALPPIPGLEGVPHLTNETIFALAELPKHLVVIGAGAVGLELAQAYRRLTAEVTVIEAAQPLANDDPECAAIVLDQLVREGVTIRQGVSLNRVEPGIRVVMEGPHGSEIIEASHLLVAAGRQPNVRDLGLGAAGIAHGPDGIRVRKNLRTTNKRVYAIGDVTGGRKFTHVSNYHASLVIRNALFGLPVNVRSGTVPWVTYTDPELAHVGLTELQAVARYRAIRVLRWPFAENDRAQTDRQQRGHVKVLTTRRGRILGATIVGPHAGELITPWTLAIASRLNIRTLAKLIIPYPTLSEVSKRAAMSYFTPGLTNPWLQRIIALVRRFG